MSTKRYRDVLNPIKTEVSSEDVARIKEEGEAAKELLESEQFLFFREYLNDLKKSIVEIIINNRVKKVRESVTDQNTGVTKELETSKEEQMNELSGQYKLIERIFQDLTVFAVLPEELEKGKLSGKVEVKESDEG
jgi:hypothetical protein